MKHLFKRLKLKLYIFIVKDKELREWNRAVRQRSIRAGKGINKPVSKCKTIICF